MMSLDCLGGSGDGWLANPGLDISGTWKHRCLCRGERDTGPYTDHALRWL